MLSGLLSLLLRLDLRFLPNCSTALSFLRFNVLNNIVLIFAQGHHVHLNHTKSLLGGIWSLLAHLTNARIETLHYNTLRLKLPLLLFVELRCKAVVFKGYVVTLILGPVLHGLLHHSVVRIRQLLHDLLHYSLINWPFLTPEPLLRLFVHAIVLLHHRKFHLWRHICKQEKLVLEIILRRRRQVELWLLGNQILLVGLDAEALSSNCHTWVA